MKAALLALGLAILALMMPLQAGAAGPSAAAAQAGAPAASGENLAILDFRSNNVSAGDAAVVSDFVRSAFVKAGTYTVVDKANMDRILAEQAFQQTGCTDSDCAVKLGKLLNVQKMVVGNYSMAGSVRFLTASLVDVETGGIEWTGKVKGFEPGEIDTAADDLARQLIEGAQAEESPSTPPAKRGSLRAVAAEAATAADREREAARLERERLETERRAEREAMRLEKERLRAEREAESARRRAEVDAARIARGRIGLGLNFPGVGLRALLGNRAMIEALGQYEKEAQSYGGRLYLYVFPGSRVYPYLGAGGGYAKFTGDGLAAGGYLGEAFAGLEYFIWKRLSLQGDIGPTYVGLKEGAVAVSGLRFVVNFGLTVYF